MSALHAAWSGFPRRQGLRVQLQVPARHPARPHRRIAARHGPDARAASSTPSACSTSSACGSNCPSMSRKKPARQPTELTPAEIESSQSRDQGNASSCSRNARDPRQGQRRWTPTLAASLRRRSGQGQPDLLHENPDTLHLSPAIPFGNTWASCYFAMTGFHALHVFGGIVIFGIISLIGLMGRLGPQPCRHAGNHRVVLALRRYRLDLPVPASVPGVSGRSLFGVFV